MEPRIVSKQTDSKRGKFTTLECVYHSWPFHILCAEVAVTKAERHLSGSLNGTFRIYVQRDDHNTSWIKKYTPSLNITTAEWRIFRHGLQRSNYIQCCNKQKPVKCFLKTSETLYSKTTGQEPPRTGCPEKIESTYYLVFARRLQVCKILLHGRKR